MYKREQGKFIITRQPCEICGSSDAYAERADGSGKCFSCGINIQPEFQTNKINYLESETNNMENKYLSVIDIEKFNSFPIGSRKISLEIVNYFNVKMSVNQEGQVDSHFYPHTEKNRIVAYKERILEDKKFSIHGKIENTELFGQAQCTDNRSLVITEGELDAMSVAQAYKDNNNAIYPVVSIRSATGIKSALKQRKFFNSFEKIVLMMDDDEAGFKAQEELARHLPTGKVFIAKLPEKDASETLINHGHSAIISAFWNAEPWSPAGIVVGEEAWRQYIERQAIQSVPYPDCIGTLNVKLKGMRQGEITLFTSGTGSGKSTVVKEIILNIIKTTEDSVGLISLEESVGDTVEKFIGMEMETAVFDLEKTSEEDQRKAYDSVFGEERLILLDHQGSVGDSSLLDNIAHLCAMGCKFLVLDHITIAVSEGTGGKTGNEAMDAMMSDLLKIVKKHNVWLGIISHLRKSVSGSESFEEGKLASIDDIKGSGSIKQISFDIVSFGRNLTHEDPEQRNTVKFRVLKSRYTGDTGYAGAARFDINTGRLTAVLPEEDFIEEEDFKALNPPIDFNKLKDVDDF